DDVPETGLPAVLAGQHDASGLRMPVGGEAAEALLVVELVVAVVLEGAVSVDAGLVRKRIAAGADVVERQRLAECVAGPERKPAGPRQVDRVTDRVTIA